MRVTVKLLLLLALAACGAPGSDSVFTRNNPKIPSVEPKAKVTPRRAPTIATEVYAGYYRKVGDDSRFQPCGTTQLLEITGSPVAKLLLRERFRWNAIWEGVKLFAVFQGTIVTDSAIAAGTTPDSAKKGPTKRFWLVEVDSMRTWRNGDCNGMRVPKG